MTTTNNQEATQEPRLDGKENVDDDYPEEKSSVVPGKAGRRPKEFNPDDPVTFADRQGSRKSGKEMLIDTYRYNSGSWEYQLKDVLTGAQWEGGKWFKELELSQA